MESDEEAGCCGQQKKMRRAARSQAKVKIPASLCEQNSNYRARWFVMAKITPVRFHATTDESENA
jgi:hypothetical protein